QIVGEEAELAKGLAEGWLEDTNPSRPKKSFSQLPVAVQRHCIRIQLLAEEIAADFDLVEKLRLKPDEAVTIDKLASVARSISRNPDGLIHLHQAVSTSFCHESRNLSLGDSAGQT